MNRGAVKSWRIKWLRETAQLRALGFGPGPRSLGFLLSIGGEGKKNTTTGIIYSPKWFEAVHRNLETTRLAGAPETLGLLVWPNFPWI
ncbi:hypothetical protein KOW79_013278 [Hemibagrus wyckioides]|uniref:Uncharacterized protein n=1 Tax=Hemibagrus wyckioides TaxID=337641 RepID=A0A9D3NHG9_9TELE|nr:hypothetical protein KOW79_013278 [Hemibagrus wyckioides]